MAITADRSLALHSKTHFWRIIDIDKINLGLKLSKPSFVTYMQGVVHVSQLEQFGIDHLYPKRTYPTYKLPIAQRQRSTMGDPKGESIGEL